MPRTVKRPEGPATLPPAGDARRDELKRRTDSLEALADEQLAEREAIDPAKLVVENEVAQHIVSGVLDVPGAQPEYAYCWANFQSQHGMQVTTKQAQGWEVVCGDMPECPGRRDELGRRRVADVILMRIPLDRYIVIQREERYRAMLQQKGVSAALEELGQKYAGQGIIVRSEMDEETLKRVGNRALAQQIAGQQFSNLLRDGRVPGLKPGQW